MRVVILAGGRSRRFQGDKLAAKVNGSASLARVVARTQAVASEVLVAVPSAPRERELVRLLGPGCHYLRDHPRTWGGGPAGAMAGALASCGDGPLLFVPGDMPWLETRALGRFLELADASGADVGVPCWSSGETENLVQFHRSARSLRHLPLAWWEGKVARRASEFLRCVPRTALVPIPTLTRSPWSFLHLTYRSDLERPSGRGRFGAPAATRTTPNRSKEKYHEAHSLWALRAGDQASKAFAEESSVYARAGLTLLAQHAAEDSATVRAGGPVPKPHRVRAPPRPYRRPRGRGTVNASAGLVRSR